MTKTTTTSLFVALSAGSAMAAIDINLPGATDQQSWSGLNGTNYPTSAGFNSFPTNTLGWASPIASNTDDATFDKVAGTGGFPATEAIYNFTTPGEFFVTETSALSGLETVVFQTDMIGPLTTPPTIDLNGGDQNLAADFSALATGDFAGMGSDSSVYAYQWDLSGLGPINDFVIEWGSGMHGTNYFMQLNQGDSFVQVVPEPSTYALLAGVAALGLILMRRKTR